MAMTALLQCTCSHPDQDRRYGARIRVHNYATKASKGQPKATYRCTVCGATRQTKDSE